MTEKDEVVWDEEFIRTLPIQSQRRLIRLVGDMLEAEICDQYGLPHGSLMEKVDPFTLEPEDYRDELERQALAIASPLAGITDPDELHDIHIRQQKEGEDGTE